MTAAVDTVDHRGRRRFGDTAAIVATVLAVVPVWVAALRAGFAHVPPIGDAALTVLRAQDVFSAHPPLVGMVAAGASGGAHDVFFPGPWELYVLAGPTRLFGIVWGPVLAMAALNTVWIVVACRLLLRRLDRVGALVGIVFLAVFGWAIGSGMLITPVPMDMVTIPFVTFLIAVWCVASGDLDALPALALVANFLWLSHLVLIMLVPVIGLCTVVGVIVTLRRSRGRVRDGGEDSAEPVELRRPLIVALAVTVVMWIPTAIDQVTGNPGNLGQLLGASGEPRESVASWATSIHVVIEMIGRPPFWFRGSLARPGYAGAPIGPEVIGAVTVFDLVVGLVIVAVFAWLMVLAVRRHDRVSLWALTVAAVAAAASIPNVYLAPMALDVFPFVYLRSLHGVTMFVWFAVVVTAWRLGRGRLPRVSTASLRWALVGVIGVFTVANLPTGSKGYGTDAREARLVRSMNAGVLAELDHDEPIRLRSGWNLPSQIQFASLALALADAGVPMCIAGDMGPQLDRACPEEPRRTVTVITIDEGGPEPDHQLWRGDNLDADERAELDRLDDRWNRWLAARDEVVLTAEAAALVARDLSPGRAAELASILAPDDGVVTDIQHTFAVRSLISAMIAVDDGRGVSPFVDAPLQGADLLRWNDLADENIIVVVTDT